jgi:hypothetical protein
MRWYLGMSRWNGSLFWKQQNSSSWMADDGVWQFLKHWKSNPSWRSWLSEKASHHLLAPEAWNAKQGRPLALVERMMLLKHACLYKYGVSEQSYLFNTLPITKYFALPSHLPNKRDDIGRDLKLYTKVPGKCWYEMYSLFSSWCMAFRQVHILYKHCRTHLRSRFGFCKQADLSNLQTLHKKLNNDCSFYSFIIQPFSRKSDKQKVGTLNITTYEVLHSGL